VANFGPGEAIWLGGARGTPPGPPHETTIYGGMNLNREAERASFNALYLQVGANSIESKSFQPFLPQGSHSAPAGPPHKTTIYGGINLSRGKERASFDALYLRV
jgi:hypothetical protein